MEAKVSIIIPTSNRPDHLKEAISSCLDQTYKNIEIVVVDDNLAGSSGRHRTEEVLKEYEEDPRFIYHRNIENVGGAESRNIGISLCTGQYCTFLDDDDLYLPEKVEKQVELMIEQGYECTFTDAMLYNENDELIDYRKHDYITSLKNEDLLVNHILHRLTATPTLMYKTESIRKIGGFDDVLMGHEYQLMLKTIESGLKIGYLPECYVKLYVHKRGGISTSSVKVIGEKELFKQSKTYFHLLTPAQRRYVRFRYHTVLMVVGLRGKNWSLALKEFIFAVFSSPKDALYELYRRRKNFRALKEAGKL